ncbi:MAG: hypothetical protein PQJ46_12460 [Spirochaetales bacterium]|nr:hypothetical protein [Spirochaetales bacterium]
MNSVKKFIKPIVPGGNRNKEKDLTEKLISRTRDETRTSNKVDQQKTL